MLSKRDKNRLLSLYKDQNFDVLYLLLDTIKNSFNDSCIKDTEYHTVIATVEKETKLKFIDDLKTIIESEIYEEL